MNEIKSRSPTVMEISVIVAGDKQFTSEEGTGVENANVKNGIELDTGIVYQLAYINPFQAFSTELFV